MAFQLQGFPSVDDPAQFKVWLAGELRRFERYMETKEPIELLFDAPQQPIEGQIVRADGTSWNPGSGRGFYGYDNGAWVLLG